MLEISLPDVIPDDDISSAVVVVDTGKVDSGLSIALEDRSVDPASNVDMAFAVVTMICEDNVRSGT